MKTDLDRWVDVEGPPPEGVRELLDAVVPPLTPELQERLDRKVFAAIAAHDRKRAARRRALGLGAVAAFLALAVASVGGSGLIAARARKRTAAREAAKEDVAKVAPRATSIRPDGGRSPERGPAPDGAP
jgi:hypothetical protein